MFIYDAKLLNYWIDKPGLADIYITKNISSFTNSEARKLTKNK